MDGITYYYLDNFYLGHCDSLPLDTPIGLVENTLKNKFSVYPNPTKNKLTIAYLGSEKLVFRLFNVLGKLQEVEVIPNRNQYQLSIAHLPKGLYFLEIIAGKNRITKKIVKD